MLLGIVVNYVGLLKLLTMLFRNVLRTKSSALVGSSLLLLMTSLYCVLIFIAREQFPVALFISLELLGAVVTLFLAKSVFKLFSRPNH